MNHPSELKSWLTEAAGVLIVAGGFMALLILL